MTSQIDPGPGDLVVEIYRDTIRPMRTRAFSMDIPARENSPEILFTLLGVELKVGRRRIGCPDLATARYLRVFAAAGCTEVAVPYDITTIAVIADELEVAWQSMLLHCDRATKGMSAQLRGRARAAEVRRVRDMIAETGPGEAIPLFKNSTRQRRN